MEFDLINFLPLVLLLLATGCVAGILAGLLGVGGGIVIVPVLYLLFPILGVDDSVLMHLAVGTSLATIIPTSLMSARSHFKKGGLDISLLKSIWFGVFAGVLVGAYLGGKAQGSTLTLLFGVVALLVSLQMAFNTGGGKVMAEKMPGSFVFRTLMGVCIGAFSVVIGIGGGTFSVPLFSMFNVPIRKAVGTASAIGTVIAVPGTAGFILSGMNNSSLPDFTLGYVSILGFLLIVPATVATAPLGAKIAHTINPASLRKAFAFFLFLTSLKMLYSVFTG